MAEAKRGRHELYSKGIGKIVLEVTKEYPVVLVTGPRQVGKTTMLQRLMKGTDRGYVSLDDLNERNLAKTDPELFLQLHKPPVLIDEVQYAPELFTYVKIHIDKNQNAGAFWLTGSQVFKLMHGVQESLAGRVAVLALTSLSQAEIGRGETEPFTLDMDSLTARFLRQLLVKTPKLYFYDTGLVCYLTKWSSAETLESGAMNGAILENYVVAEIMKTYLNSGSELFKVVNVEMQDTMEEYVTLAADTVRAQKEYFTGPMGNDIYQFSSFPWVSFTHISHMESGKKDNATPMIDWGKYAIRDGKTMLPFSVQVYHSFVDGVHIAKLAEGLQNYLDHSE